MCVFMCVVLICLWLALQRQIYFAFFYKITNAFGPVLEVKLVAKKNLRAPFFLFYELLFVACLWRSAPHMLGGGWLQIYRGHCLRYGIACHRQRLEANALLLPCRGVWVQRN